MDVDKLQSQEILERCIRALHEKDRLNYSGKFVQGFVHNVNGPLQNLTMLTEMLVSGLELQDRIFSTSAGENEKWSELLGKQRKRLAQMREQIANLAADLREFMQLHEIERCGTEVDINALLTRMAKVFRSDLFFKHNIKSELRLAKNLPHVRVLGRDIVPAVFHLFHNAIAALRESPKKELIVETSLQDGEIVAKITDSGAGLPEGLQPDVFFDLFESRWQKSDDKAQSTDQHLGFGLYAARQLLMPYGFTISLERSSEGTSALIRMPLKKKPA
ncbi:ATP-binding region, ATPase domain protein domain protein [Syntrophobacter sp. SbD1]|nr:ATP-binding region, ATPase domain protein domain protein [Syntrophobacter sp. SbD1]